MTQRFGYMQPANMTPQSYADDLVAKSSKVADVFYEETLKDIFTENVDASISHSFRHD